MGITFGRAALTSLQAALIGAVLVGCSTVPSTTAPAALPAGFSARAVTAHQAVRGSGPFGITDRFALDGSMYAWLVIEWADVDAAWGPQTIEVRWYSGDRLIRRQRLALEVARSPFHVWSRMLPIAIGPGSGRVEFYWHDQRIAAHDFEVVPRVETRERPAT